MPVPASYNDITQSKELRDFVGWAWYDNEFNVPPELTTKRVVLRIDSAHYNTIVVSSTQASISFRDCSDNFITFRLYCKLHGK